VTNLFLIILIANVLGLVLDILVSPFPSLEASIQNPTSDITFTGALAGVSMLIVLFVEAKTKGVGKFFYHYLPIF
jgi:F0F1-type ATP synthase membrane subunit a